MYIQLYNVHVFRLSFTWRASAYSHRRVLPSHYLHPTSISVKRQYAPLVFSYNNNLFKQDLFDVKIEIWEVIPLRLKRNWEYWQCTLPRSLDLVPQHRMKCSVIVPLLWMGAFICWIYRQCILTLLSWRYISYNLVREDMNIVTWTIEKSRHGNKWNRYSSLVLGQESFTA